eukprot:404896-Alexandrium_andersonii.AAC.1
MLLVTTCLAWACLHLEHWKRCEFHPVNKESDCNAARCTQCLLQIVASSASGSGGGGNWPAAPLGAWVPLRRLEPSLA